MEIGLAVYIYANCNMRQDERFSFYSRLLAKDVMLGKVVKHEFKGRLLPFAQNEKMRLCKLSK